MNSDHAVLRAPAYGFFRKMGLSEGTIFTLLTPNQRSRRMTSDATHALSAPQPQTPREAPQS